MVKRSLLSSLLVLTSFASVALAQDKMMQPAPELKKLNYFVGTWKTQADVQPGSFDPGGSEPAGIGSDPAKAAFSYQSFSSTGEHETATGVLSGDTWTWTSSSPFKWRFVEKVISPESFSLKFETSQDGVSWSTMMEGAATKQ